MQNRWTVLNKKNFWELFVSSSAFGVMGVICLVGYYMVYLNLSLELSAWPLILTGGSLISLLIVIGIILFAQHANASFVFPVLVGTLAGGSSGAIVIWILLLLLDLLGKTHSFFADLVLILANISFLALGYPIAVYAGVSIAVGFPLFLSRVLGRTINVKRLFLLGAISGGVVGVILFMLVAGFRDYVAFTFISVMVAFQLPATIGGALVATKLR